MTILKQADENPYFGLTLTENLNSVVISHSVTKITKRLQQLLKTKPQKNSTVMQISAYIYISLVRSILDYGSIVCYHYLKHDVEKPEKVQRQAAR